MIICPDCGKNLIIANYKMNYKPITLYCVYCDYESRHLTVNDAERSVKNNGKEKLD